jgi:hypothetical protein
LEARQLPHGRDALNRGDYDTLRAQTLASFGTPAVTEAFARHMVDERNAALIPTLRRILDDGAAVFVVGAISCRAVRYRYS